MSFGNIVAKKPFWICLENIRSAYNVGSILRTADGTGLWGAITIGITPKATHPKVVKTALGAQKSVPSYHFNTVEEFLRSLESLDNHTLWALELTDQAENLFKIEDLPKENLFIVVGNEITGVSARLLVAASKHIFIPMHGLKGSLNVAEASSILMYEFYRRVIRTVPS